MSTPGILLLLVMAAALFASPALAHEVHGDHTLVVDAAIDSDEVRPLVRAFRETGDDRFLDRAWALIEPELLRHSQDVGVLIDAALVEQARHRFDYALKLTERALAIRGNNDQAWLLLASIHLVLGDNAEAAIACRRLRNVPLLITLTCQARVALAMNEFEHVRLRFDRVLDVTDPDRHDNESLAWSFSVAGDLAVAAGESERAVTYFSRSLELAESTQVRSALVDVLLDNDKVDEAESVIAAGAPALPLDIRRMIVAKRQGRSRDVAADVHHADHEFQAWIASEDWLHSREMARFYLDVLERPALARRLAEINLGLQKEPEDLRLRDRTRS